MKENQGCDKGKSDGGTTGRGGSGDQEWGADFQDDLSNGCIGTCLIKKP